MKLVALLMALFGVPEEYDFNVQHERGGWVYVRWTRERVVSKALKNEKEYGAVTAVSIWPGGKYPGTFMGDNADFNRMVREYKLGYLPLPERAPSLVETREQFLRGGGS